MIIEFLRSIYGLVNIFGWIMIALGIIFVLLDTWFESKPSQWLVKDNLNAGTWIISIYLVIVALSQTPYFETDRPEEYNAFLLLSLSVICYYVIVHFVLLRNGYSVDGKLLKFSETEEKNFLQVLFNKILIVGFLIGLLLTAISPNKTFYIVCLVLLPFVKEIRESYIENKEILKKEKDI